MYEKEMYGNIQGSEYKHVNQGNLVGDLLCGLDVASFVQFAEYQFV